ncbi:amidase [Acidiferrimicrobium sp. IK]|uniref:amidase n=1 Tax=Acidiferrimicrobium sp. IK TaxID=2871700 RepID=UPI0021CB1764|nr:amidase [Acidiferrimicrobium sp. IK]MCU4183183.1 amidase [Acidiferrimicrobium sp. IK]
MNLDEHARANLDEQVRAAAGLAERLRALRVGPRLLAPGAPEGPLAGTGIVVKDLIDVAGVATGAGNPQWLADAPVPKAHAPAVTRLVEAGASVVGKSHTDELAFSLSGTNIHYGTPANPAAPGRVPGGSSSGSASAVAGGLVPAALATDTGGSIRVPASYCGVWGLRPTHGRVPLAGVVEFAPSFGTVGVLAATGSMLETAGLALLQGAAAAVPDVLVVADDLLAEADPAAAAAVADAARRLAASLGVELRRGELSAGRLGAWLGAFRGRQFVEAWRSHGGWIERRRPLLGPGIAARFAEASATDPAAWEPAGAAGEEVRAALAGLVPAGGALVLPSAATVAPPVDLEGPAKDDLRLRTLRLTCVAGLGGLPAVSLPLAAVGGLPLGVCLLAGRGDDERLLAAARAAGTAARPPQAGQ